ncbi:hypothetical protein AWC20_11345 [Mycobacterium parmense]|nr:hypothetical protein AWC20_11345 [Mycobacterium parmense]
MPVPAGVVGDDLVHLGGSSHGESFSLIVFSHGECAGAADHQVDVAGVVVERDGVVVVFSGRGLVVQGPPSAKGEGVGRELGGQSNVAVPCL